ncbi:MAG: glutamine--tRNA ligase/YqeY domain fusion protein [Chitinispirillia bacterium]|nr:glutamine--tRNA ligase/YqeY domain fusion protein [Chitinispirillia bacterium]MCL2241935.1 glutamine--tRNA ligase/YqeY domain fusion protein [Chitinispirillia bacterium]
MESSANSTASPEAPVVSNFIRDMIKDDMQTGKWGGKVVTRFPPEPNGYLHIGHAKAICIDFGMAKEFGGECHLRFDDTNPSKEEDEYINSIKADVSWLGFDWGPHLYFASDYFDRMYEYAVRLIKAGKAYVDDLTAEQIREYRGTLTEPGRESPHRNRSVDENMGLFEGMRDGKFAEGSRVLRAKIDMAHPNMNMRDPVMYRIMNASHHRTGDKWKIYPMYDWAHGLEDSAEGVTHSLCTLEFEAHRPLYDWFLAQLDGIHRPQQTEFARLNLTYTVMSKRKLLQLVREGRVSGWDDPRMPTISGLRRRGYSPESIKNFAERIGVAKRDSTVDLALLEFCLREDLNKTSKRVMAVLNPVKVVIENYPEGQVEEVDAVNNPEDESAGTRKVPFSRVIYIERDDFMEDPPKKFFRLSPGKEVRLRYAYFITCKDVIKDNAGNIIELRCTYDPQTKGGDSPDGRSPKATLHWVSAQHAIGAEVRIYESLFTKENPDDAGDGGTFLDNINPESLKTLTDCKLEPSLASAKAGEKYQFERLAYFCVDQDSSPGKPVFNRTVTLKDTWARIQKRS